MWLKLDGAHLDSTGSPNLWTGKPTEMSVLVAEGKIKDVKDVPLSFTERTRAPSSPGQFKHGYGLSDRPNARAVFGETRPQAQKMLEDIWATSKEVDR